MIKFIFLRRLIPLQMASSRSRAKGGIRSSLDAKKEANTLASFLNSPKFIPLYVFTMDQWQSKRALGSANRLLEC